MLDPTRLPCLMCLAPASVALKRDKKERPFLVCRACGCRCFLYHPESLRGIRLLAPRLMDYIQKLWAGYGDEGMAQEDRLSVDYVKKSAAHDGNVFKVRSHG